MSHSMTKPTKWPVLPVKTQISLSIRPVWWEYSLSAWKLPIERIVKILIRPSGCPGWSGYSLGAHVILLVLSCSGSYVNIMTWSFQTERSEQTVSNQIRRLLKESDCRSSLIRGYIDCNSVCIFYSFGHINVWSSPGVKPLFLHFMIITAIFQVLFLCVFMLC